MRNSSEESRNGTPRAGSPVDTPTQSRSPIVAAVSDKNKSLDVETLSIDQDHPVQTLTQAIQAIVGPGHFPPEIVHLIIQHLYYSILPAPEPFPSPDPNLHLLPRENIWSLPRLAPSRPEQLRATFRSLALVNKTWGEEATRALWRKVSFGFPKSWECVLRVVDEYDLGQRIKKAKRSDPNGSGWGLTTDALTESRGRTNVPTWSEDTKWARLSNSLGVSQSSPVRGDSSDSARTPMDVEDDFGQLMMAASLNAADSPLLYTKTISFSRFRTAGMSRSLRQGSHERFVTPFRLLNLLRGTRLGKGPLEFPGAGEDDDGSLHSIASDPGEAIDGASTPDDNDLDVRMRQTGKLEGLAFTEFMDSALTKAVLDELLFRGGYLAEYLETDLAETSDGHPYGTSAVSHYVPPPSLRSPFNNPEPLPAHREPYKARHLQTSQSRSPIGLRRPSDSSASAERGSVKVVTEDEESDEDEESLGTTGRPTRRMDHSPEVRRRTERIPFQRRSSGAAFDTLHVQSPRDESEDRGRERSGRSMAQAGRGQLRHNRSLMPPSAFAARSSSVPAPFHERGTSHTPFSSRIRGASVDTERSSSLPASASGRSGRGQTRIVLSLEGSRQVKAIRALDLCGCISTVFVRAIQECICSYRLGPPKLLPSANSSISAIDEDDSSEEGDWHADSHHSSTSHTFSHLHHIENTLDGKQRRLRRVYFPHFRRLGLTSSLLPTHLLTSFVLSFPYLTHLDLAGTLAAPELLRGLALAGQSGPGGRPMRLKALNLARCRLVTGASIVGLFCGDCPPFTSHAGMEADEAWGNGEAVSELIDCSFYGDAAHASPLSLPELRLLLTISPAFTSGHLRTLDLASTPLTDDLLLNHFPPQPHLLELGLGGCRGITMRRIAQFLIDKAPGVEVLDLSNAAPGAQVVAPSSAQRRATLSTPTLSIFELHTVLLQSVASVASNVGESVETCQSLLAKRKTNLRVVELDEKALDAVQGGAANWKPIWGKGRRGWYVDVASTSAIDRSASARGPRKLVHLPEDDPQRQALVRLFEQNGSVATETGWHPRKMEVIRGDGMMGREEGLYAYQAFSV